MFEVYDSADNWFRCLFFGKHYVRSVLRCDKFQSLLTPNSTDCWWLIILIRYRFSSSGIFSRWIHGTIKAPMLSVEQRNKLKTAQLTVVTRRPAINYGVSFLFLFSVWEAFKTFVQLSGEKFPSALGVCHFYTVALLQFLTQTACGGVKYLFSTVRPNRSNYIKIS